VPSPRSTISILLPVFNGSAFLSAQLASIAAQTYGDFEVLVYDDASTDGSIELQRHFAAVDGRFYLSAGVANYGQRAALGKLLRKARGDYVMFSDQDDVWHPRLVETLLSSIGQASLAYGTSQLIDADGKPTGKTIFDYNGQPIEGRDRFDFLFRSVVSGHCMLVRRDTVVDEVFQQPSPHDWLIAVIATFSSGVVHVPEAIVGHRQHATNQHNSFGKSDRVGALTGRAMRIQRLDDALAVLSAAPAISRFKRSLFEGVHCSLLAQIKDKPRVRFYNREFEAAFGIALEHLAIPLDERARALKAISKICRGWLHPKALRDALMWR
jgi:glycosyltransferase involved in cell wall biosynthesis